MKAEVDKFKNIFEGFDKGFGVFSFKESHGPKQKGANYTSRDLLTDEIWNNHLEGIKFKPKVINQDGKEFFPTIDSIGIAPVKEDHTCKWGCIDIDEYPINFKELNKKIRERKLPLILCKSKSKGAHAFLFSKTWVSAKLMQTKITEIAQTLGQANLDRIYPIQAEPKIREQGEIGNWLNIPYYHYNNPDKTKWRCAIKDDGSEASLSEFFKLHDKYSLTIEQLETFNIPLEDTWFKEGPICLKTMATFGFVEGQRNNTLTEIGIYLKKRFPDSWESQLESYNNYWFKNLDGGPLGAQEVLTIKNSLKKKDYFYGCKKAPLKPFCRAHECRLQKFGVGDGHVPENSFGKLSVMMSNPKVWFLTWRGQSVVLKSRELATQRLWQIAATEQTGKTPQILKQKDWETLLNKLQGDESLTIIPADPETTNKGKLRKHLTYWCCDLTKVDEKNDGEFTHAYLDQSPFHDKEGTVWFKFDWFWKYLITQKQWEMEENQTRAFLSKILKDTQQGGMDRKEDKRCIYIHKEYFEELEEPEPKKMEEPESPY
jgi:hypothetical protein